MKQVADHTTEVIDFVGQEAGSHRALDGGLLAQMLAGRGLSAATVAIDPGVSRGFDVVGIPRRGSAVGRVLARGLEGVVAKCEREPYVPGARLRVKTKKSATARVQEELPGMTRRGSSKR